jgi:hypothetical protein
MVRWWKIKMVRRYASKSALTLLLSRLLKHTFIRYHLLHRRMQRAHNIDTIVAIFLCLLYRLRPSRQDLTTYRHIELVLVANGLVTPLDTALVVTTLTGPLLYDPRPPELHSVSYCFGI